MNPANGVLAGTPTTAGTFSFSVSVTDQSPIPQVASKVLAVTFAPVTLVFSLQPTDTNSGLAIPVKVKAQDNSGNPFANVTITVSLNGSAAPLTGTTVAVTGADGLASFPNLAITTPGNYQFKATAPGAATAVSATFNITAQGGSITTIAGHTWAPSLLPTTATSFPLGEVEGIAKDAAGNLYVADSGNDIVVRITAAGALTVVAGNGTQGYSGDGGSATSAQLNSPRGVAIHPTTGDLYISDYGNRRVRKVSGGIITTVAGNGTSGYSGDNVVGGATLAQINGADSLAFDPSGNLYIADAGNDVIRKLTAAGTISTVAGTGTGGFSGDGAAATLAKLSGPAGVVYSGGNLYIADTANHRVRKVDNLGNITTIAGTGTNSNTGNGVAATTATLSSPSALAADAGGDIFITVRHQVRMINTAGTITTVAGTVPGFSGDGGLATNATMDLPEGVVVDASGNIFITDPTNGRVRRVDGTTRIITTFAGTGVMRAQRRRRPGNQRAYLNFPIDVASDPAGNIYIADRDNNRIRKLNTAGIITTVAGTGLPGATGDGGAATSATLGDFTDGVGVDVSGNFYIADNGYANVRKVTPGNPGTISTITAGPAFGVAADTAGNVYAWPTRVPAGS